MSMSSEKFLQLLAEACCNPTVKYGFDVFINIVGPLRNAAKFTGSLGKNLSAAWQFEHASVRWHDYARTHDVSSPSFTHERAIWARAHRAFYEPQKAAFRNFCHIVIDGPASPELLDSWIDTKAWPAFVRAEAFLLSGKFVERHPILGTRLGG